MKSLLLNDFQKHERTVVNKNFIVLMGFIIGITIFYIYLDSIKHVLLKLFKQQKIKNKDDPILVCINCGSTNIRNDLSKDMIAWKGTTRLECVDCEYSSITFPLIPKSQVEEFREIVKNRSEEDKKKLSETQNSKGINLKLLRKSFK